MDPRSLIDIILSKDFYKSNEASTAIKQHSEHSSYNLTDTDFDGNTALHLMITELQGKKGEFNEKWIYVIEELIEKCPHLVTVANHSGITPYDMIQETWSKLPKASQGLMEVTVFEAANNALKKLENSVVTTSLPSTTTSTATIMQMTTTPQERQHMQLQPLMAGYEKELAAEKKQQEENKLLDKEIKKHNIAEGMVPFKIKQAFISYQNSHSLHPSKGKHSKKFNALIATLDGIHNKNYSWNKKEKESDRDKIKILKDSLSSMLMTLEDEYKKLLNKEKNGTLQERSDALIAKLNKKGNEKDHHYARVLVLSIQQLYKHMEETGLQRITQCDVKLTQNIMIPNNKVYKEFQTQPLMGDNNKKEKNTEEKQEKIEATQTSRRPSH